MTRFKLILAAWFLAVCGAVAWASTITQSGDAIIYGSERMLPVAAATLNAAGTIVDPTGGNVASGAADSGNPVKTGCVFNTTLPTVTNGQRVDTQCDNRGETLVLPSSAGSVWTMFGSPVDGTTNTANMFAVAGRGQKFNGSTWDRDFTCPSTASQTVTAAATTQLVALVSSQIIRVCSIMVGIATTGTYSFVYGTGSNCGTGTTVITQPTTLTAGNVVALSAGSGSLFRTIASNALCLAAVTGNVQVTVTYAQY